MPKKATPGARAAHARFLARMGIGKPNRELLKEPREKVPDTLPPTSDWPAGYRHEPKKAKVIAPEPQDDWPVCSTEGCEERFSPERKALNFTTCLKCGSPQPNRIVDIAYSKGPVMLISPEDIPSMGGRNFK